MSVIYDIVAASGLDPAEFEKVAYAAPIVDVQNPKPAIVAGKYRGNNAAIRAYQVNLPGEWHATAFVAAHPGLAIQELTEEERERMRAEEQAPTGAAEPVGQEGVIGRSDPKPYSPPLPPAPPAEVAEEPRPEGEEVDVQPAPCGHPGCFTLVGPEGEQTTHAEGCVEFTGR